MKTRRLLGMILSSTIFITITASCSNKEETTISKVKARDTIRIDVGTEAPSLDPNKAEDVTSIRILQDLFEGLVDFDQSNKILPGMAYKWDISADGKTYTFHLRDGLKFSDGSPITAEDFVYSYQRLANPKTASPYNFYLEHVVNYKDVAKSKQPIAALGVSAPDKLTFIIQLSAPDRDLLLKNTLPFLYAVPKSTIEKHGDQWTKPGNMVSSGAYVLKEHVVNGHILLERNPHFYDAAKVSIPKVKYLPIVDINASVAGYKTGEVDLTFQTVPVDQYQTLKKELGSQFNSVEQEAMGFYLFNMKDPLLANNLKLRQALSIAIDRMALTQNVLQDGKKPLYSVVTKTIEDGKYKELGYEWGSWSREKQIAEAQRLYKEAGYSLDKPLKLKMSYNTNEMYKKISTSIAAMWKEVLGVQVELNTQDWKTFLQSRHKGSYQIARGGWYADYNSIDSYATLYKCNVPSNNSHWCNKEFDNLAAKAYTSSDSKQQQELYIKALKMVQDEYVTIPIFQFGFTRLVKPYVKNYSIETNHLDQVKVKWLKLSDAD